MRFTKFDVAILTLTAFVLLVAFALPALALQPTGVTAEALNQANLRATYDVEANLVGQIQVGTRYPVVGRSEFYPWLLLGDPQTNDPIGWVFAELVDVRGDANSVPISTAVMGESTLLPSPTLPAEPNTAPTATLELVGVALPSAPVATATSNAAVTGTVLGEINVRYGPGVEYERLGVARAGEVFEVISTHSSLPWLQVRYPASPNGLGWVAAELLEVTGNVTSLPVMSRMNFDLPTLTPTASDIEVSALLGATAVPLSPEFQALGEQLWSMILDAGFEPETSTLGALFLMDLRTGEAITYGNDVAFSGMSLAKIAILNATYEQLDTPPDAQEAMEIANMMVCSENSASNRLLARLGDGSEVQGVIAVTDYLRQLGLQNTFMSAPFFIPGVEAQSAGAPITQVDQIRAQPDPYNQFTVDEMGWLLGSMYQCAYDESGPLLTAFPQNYTPTECRQMIDVMQNNNLNQPLLFSAGVPPEVRAAHKHGWTDDTHGDAGIMFTPGGDYVLVVALHTPVFLNYEDSFPLLTELSRTVYNHYNPDAPIAETRDSFIVPVADCDLLGNPVIENLMSASFGQ